MLCAPALAADAVSALTCEQLYAVAQASVRYRDQGLALDRVLAVLEHADARSKLDGRQMQVLRDVVSVAYLGNATPEEIALVCVRNR